MASEKQKAAARANGAKSRGPVTPEGKRKSSRGRLSQTDAERGMLARTVVLDSESRPRFDTLITSLQAELKPETTIENLLIYKMAAAHWRLLRVWGMERTVLSNEVNGAVPAGIPFNEYEMRFDRQFTRALDRFEKFRATRSRHVQQTKTPEVKQ
jgi:hypothetical protein